MPSLAASVCRRQHHDSDRCAAVFIISFVSTVLLSLRHVADIVSWRMLVWGLTKGQCLHKDSTRGYQRNWERLRAPSDRSHWPNALYAAVRSNSVYWTHGYFSPASMSLCYDFPSESLWRLIWRTKGWRGGEGYCSLPSVVYGILQGDKLVALENKPQTRSEKNVFNPN
jgi:hypothetical protein